MNVNEELKKLIRESGRTRSGVAGAMGFPNVQTLNRRLLSSSVPKVDFAAALLDEIGYKLVIVHKDDLPRMRGRGMVVESDFEYSPRSKPEEVG